MRRPRRRTPLSLSGWLDLWTEMPVPSVRRLAAAPECSSNLRERDTCGEGLGNDRIFAVTQLRAPVHDLEQISTPTQPGVTRFHRNRDRMRTGRPGYALTGFPPGRLMCPTCPTCFTACFAHVSNLPDMCQNCKTRQRNSHRP